jgi:hypothetical protein
MSSSTPERDGGVSDGVDALLKGAETLSIREIEDIERIRAAFDSVLNELADEEKPESAAPRFPGFEVLDKAGQGGFGAVYRARDLKLDREVALKVLLPQAQGASPPGPYATAKARFLHEAKALARVRHPNVLAIHSVLEEDDRIALVTELIQGQPLSEVLEQQGPLSAGEAAQTGVEICRALAAVHAAGLVHRDVKTPNVLRERGGRIVLADFGLGVFLAEGKNVETCDFVAGSPLFMAPEQIRGEAIHPRVDLYSLGIVLYNLSTGKFPVTARSIPELFGKIKTGALTPLRDARPDLPEAFTQVVTKALSLDPDARFQSAGEMEQALLACAGRMPSAPSAGAPEAAAAISAPRLARSPRAVRFAIAGVAAAILVALPLLYVLGGPSLRIEARPLLNGREISEGDAVKVGDGVALRVKLGSPAFVYVLDQDDTSRVTSLFPRADISLKNPLEAGKTHELPGDGHDWEVTSRGGAERILVIASLTPLKEVEDALGAGGLTEELVTRSITRLKSRDASAPPRGADGLARIVEEMKRTGENGEESKGIWVRKITLRNP